ncbi:MAG: 3-deoxy-D-manno-octulosonic acid transferase [Phycisphaera sp.]|nr:3-deoxy-D-manno-octulosonic acid transferase [Phycisphaera sp.]
MAWVYDIAYAGAAIVLSPVLAYRMVRSGKHRTDWPARFGRVDPALPTKSRKRLLVHAVSVGEVNAVRPMVDHISQRRPDVEVVVSATTDTGVARAREIYASHHRVLRTPYDATFAVRRFLDAVSPDAVALAELEVWPNMMLECQRRGVPVCVVNGRLSERSFRGYHRFRSVIGPTFKRVAAVAAQTEAYAQRFRGMGVPEHRVTVADSMKWDGVKLMTPDRVHGSMAMRDAMGVSHDAPVIVAGSTGPGEEALLIDVFKRFPPHTQLVLVPRKPERFEEVARLLPDGEIVRRSQHPDGSQRKPDQRRVFLLDTMGELNKAYAWATVALVGRSFVPMHGSNPVEPIALGRPTVIGPHHGDFQEMVDALADGHGIVVSPDPGQAVIDLLHDPTRRDQLAENGRRVIVSRQGATARHAAVALSLLDEQT